MADQPADAGEAGQPRVAARSGVAAGESGAVLPASARAFLAAYSECGSIRMAASAAGIHRSTHYDRLRDLPGYAEAFAEAREDAGDRLVEEARRRAETRWDEPVFQGGQQVGTIRRYSDGLLLALLRAVRPTEFVHPRAMNVTQIVGQQIGQLNQDNRSLDISPARQAEYADWLRIIREGEAAPALPAPDEHGGNGDGHGGNGDGGRRQGD